MTTEEAFERGYAANKNGKSGAPILDPMIMEALAGRKVGAPETKVLLLAWQHGWDEANVEEQTMTQRDTERFVRAYRGAKHLQSTLFTAMDLIEAVADRLKLEKQLTGSAERLNRQLYTTMDEINMLTRMVTSAEWDMEATIPIVESSDTPIDVLVDEGVFRMDWMAYEAVEVDDDE